MKLIILTLIVAVCTAAQLPSRSYLPLAPSSQQGSTSQSQFQTSSSSSFNAGATFVQGSGGAVNRRPQQEVEKNAAILKLEQEVSENGFHYSYETSNGIRAEESGNAAGSQGGFSYKGDDGNTYTITFTANEGGFQPQGAHLPVAPPTPEAILLALQQNQKDEAAGIFDDGKYNPQKHGGGRPSQINQGSFISSSSSGQTGQGSFSSSSSQTSFGTANHQGTFNANTGYKY